MYQNVLGTSVLGGPGFERVGDDLALLAADGCRLSRYVFEVTGLADPAGEAGPYAVEFSLYDNCPNRSGAVIPGTEGQIEFPDAGPRRIEFVVPADTDVHLPSQVWLHVGFDRANASPVLGAPALIGFSEDVIDIPAITCRARLGTFPNEPYGAFNVEVYVRGDCPASFPAYQNMRINGVDLTAGANRWMADDVELGVASCDMIAYEYGVRNAGSYVFHLYAGGELPGDPIPLTGRSFEKSTAGSEVARFTFDPPVPIPQNVWMAFRGDTLNARWIFSNEDAAIGHTRASYAVLDPVAGWRAVSSEEHFGFYGRILCAGEAPRGACCDMFVTQCDGGPDNGLPCAGNAGCAPPGTCESVCREVPQMNCPFPPRGSNLEPGWVVGGSCDSDPFPFTCGAAACCTPDDDCQNLTRNECDAYPPAEAPRQWQRGRYCGEDGQSCPFVSCLLGARGGDCAADQRGRGCRERLCCAQVCEDDPWCCLVRWDRACLQRYEAACTGPPPLNNTCPSAKAFDLEPVDHLFGSAIVSNAKDPLSAADPGFSCHTTSPGGGGAGSIWYTFTATHASARIHTCKTVPFSDDTLTAVYEVGDPSDPLSSCGSLEEIACSDNEPACGAGRGSDVCVDGLVPGETYYVQLASARAERRGILDVEISSPCAVVTAVAGDATSAGPQRGRAHAGPSREPDVGADQDVEAPVTGPEPFGGPHETLGDPPRPRPQRPPSGVAVRPRPVTRNGFTSVQVNVDHLGNNIPGDAANEPSIAVDPTDPNTIVIGWRQFDTVASNFRQAGWAYSHDGGATWTAPGVIDPGVFRSDPVLDADSNGVFYYYSLTSTSNNNFRYDLFRSFDGGVTWDEGVYARGGDKAWFAVDRTLNASRGHLYAFWTSNFSCCAGHFTRSVDGGDTFMNPIQVPQRPFWGTIAIAQDGAIYLSSYNGTVVRSSSAGDPSQPPVFEHAVNSNIGGQLTFREGPNPDGLLGQMWVAVEPPGGANPDHVYLLGSVHSEQGQPTDVRFTRSLDRGESWSRSIRVNDDPADNGAWHWFGTMSVAPSGRIDAVWNDTRNTGRTDTSELFYAYSADAGETWTANVPVSPAFNSHLGWPNQNKLGDYYHSVSDNVGVNVAYAATFNGEQDVYFLRLEPFFDCDNDGLYDPEQVAKGLSPDCNANLVPDECEPDLDGDGITDACDPDVDDDGVVNDEDICRVAGFAGLVDSEGRPRADTNRNCRLDAADFWRFHNCLKAGRPGVPAPHDACQEAFDANGNEKTDLPDFAAWQNQMRRPLR